MDKIDIVVVVHDRPKHTEACLTYLKDRTPRNLYKLIVVDNGSRDETVNILKTFEARGDIDHLILNEDNAGVEVAYNIGLSQVESDVFISSDNDILVPDLQPSWLEQQRAIFESHSDYGAIALRPQVLLGVGPIFKDAQDDVVENNLCGGVMRMMRTSLIKGFGWDSVLRKGGRGQEEWDICGKIKQAGYKVGYCTNLWAYHLFGDKNWGYLKGEQGERFLTEAPDDVAHDPKTMEPVSKCNQ